MRKVGRMAEMRDFQSVAWKEVYSVDEMVEYLADVMAEKMADW